MSTSSQRGRAVRSAPRQGRLRAFYFLLGAIVIAGVAMIATATLGKQAAPAATGAALGGQSLPARGAADAPVTVVEYADFQCPACGSFATQQEAQFERDYVDTGKVRLLYHDFPLPQHHNAILAAEAGRCATDQNAFWEMHRLLFANQAEWADQPQPLTQFLGYAGALKLNAASFRQCLDSHSHRSEVLASQQASYQANIQQTPTFVIGGRQYLASELRAAVDAALQAKAR